MDNKKMDNNYSRVFIASSELFSGFKTEIQLTEVESIEDIIKIFRSNLNNVLERNHLEILVNKLNDCSFHIHSYSIEDILTSTNETVFYICDHC